VSYQGKTNWKYDDTVTEQDMNRIEKGIVDAHADNKEIDQKLSRKARIIVSESPPPVSQREQGAFYFRVTDSIPTPSGPDNMRVSPNMGIKIKE